MSVFLQFCRFKIDGKLEMFIVFEMKCSVKFVTEFWNNQTPRQGKYLWIILRYFDYVILCCQEVVLYRTTIAICSVEEPKHVWCEILQT